MWRSVEECRGANVSKGRQGGVRGLECGRMLESLGERRRACEQGGVLGGSE